MTDGNQLRIYHGNVRLSQGYWNWEGWHPGTYEYTYGITMVMATHMTLNTRIRQLPKPSLSRVLMMPRFLQSV
jgi:hypothetical protein